MAMKHINIKSVINILGILCLLSLSLLKINLANAMEMKTDKDPNLKTSRDSGTIGEKKTLQGEKSYLDPKTGITYNIYKVGTFVTPKIFGNIAYFGPNIGYNFRLACLNWKYKISAYWSSSDDTIDRVGFLVSLKSPDSTILIETKEVDMAVFAPLDILPTEEQIKIEQAKGYVEDPFGGEERILAAKQAIKWILNNDLDDYNAINNSIKFSLEQISTHAFVKTEIEVFSKKDNTTKKCVIWALNCRGYRFGGKRQAETWLCQVISDGSAYSDAMANAYAILKTFKFDKDRNVYPDLKD